MSYRFAAFKNLIERYSDAFSHAWKNRSLLDFAPRNQHEREFLPAHLELIETPVTPLPRLSMRIIILLAGLALLWSFLGFFDIVAVATGKTVLGGRTKIIQPAEKAVVSAINVKDGQFVKAGEVLMTLDTVLADAEDQKAREFLQAAQGAALRYQALLDADSSGQSPHPPTAAIVEHTNQKAQDNSLLLGQWQAYTARRSSLMAVLSQREAERVTIQKGINKLQNTVRLALEREKDYADLYEKKVVSRHDYLEKQQLRFDAQSDLAAQQSRLQEIQAALTHQQRELNSARAEFRREALDKLREAKEQIAQYQEEIKKTQQRKSYMRLVAPVSGTIQQLAIHTVGGIVTEAQPLMAIVPTSDALEVEVKIENKDIGFVKPGQTATVKVESFPYTRYGYLEGVVDSVSHDAMNDEKLGWVFQARVRLKSDYLMIEGQKIQLTAGMLVNAEIVTGKRRVISYFLSPLQEYTKESLQER